MPILSIITAVDPQAAEHLPETSESIARQVLPTGWTWEWIVQCDGGTPEERQCVRDLLPADDRVNYGASRKGGPGVARTMALARVGGRAVKVLDADDRLTDGALARDLDGLAQPGVGWVTSSVLDYRDGRLSSYEYDPQAGRIRSGEVYRAYHSENYRILVHPATLCVDYSLLLALGGWMALPASEDTALLLALDAVADGWFNAEAGMIYRHWPAQMTARPSHSDPDELAARRSLAQRRAEALDLLLDKPIRRQE